MRHITGPEQFSRARLEAMFERANHWHEQLDRLVRENKFSDTLEGRLVLVAAKAQKQKGSASSRTLGSFWSMATRLGATVKTEENLWLSSSMTKGESLYDTVRLMAGRHKFRCIVLRTDVEGEAQICADACDAGTGDACFINAGDGPGQHPSQMLLDLYTMWKRFGRIDGLKIGFVGDLTHGRVFRSDAVGLSQFKPFIKAISPSCLKMQDDTRRWLDEHKVSYEEVHSLDEHIRDLDVLMFLRLQKERIENHPTLPKQEADAWLEEAEREYQHFCMTPDRMGMVRENSIVMHPMPRGPELEPAYDNDPRVVIWNQIDNGDAIRATAFEMLMRPDKAWVKAIRD